MAVEQRDVGRLDALAALSDLPLVGDVLDVPCTLHHHHHDDDDARLSARLVGRRPLEHGGVCGGGRHLFRCQRGVSFIAGVFLAGVSADAAGRLSRHRPTHRGQLRSGVASGVSVLAAHRPHLTTDQRGVVRGHGGGDVAGALHRRAPLSQHLLRGVYRMGLDTAVAGCQPAYSGRRVVDATGGSVVDHLRRRVLVPLQWLAGAPMARPLRQLRPLAPVVSRGHRGGQRLLGARHGCPPPSRIR
eukprot:ctg_411.g204